MFAAVDAAEISKSAKARFAPIFSEEGCELQLVLELVNLRMEAGEGCLNGVVLNPILLGELKSLNKYQFVREGKGEYVSFEHLYDVPGSILWKSIKHRDYLQRSESDDPQARLDLILLLNKTAKTGSRSVNFALLPSMIDFIRNLGFKVEERPGFIQKVSW